MPSFFNNDWYLLGPTPLRKVSLYKDVALPFEEGCRFASCPYGGPIAVAQSADKTNWNVYICNAKGSIYSTFPIIEVSKLFWTKCQKLGIVLLNGEIRLYSVFGEELGVFDMNKKIRDIGFMRAMTFNKQDINLETGLAMMDNSQRFFLVNNVVDRLTWSLSAVSRQNNEPSCWTVVHTSGRTTVIVCYGEQFFGGAQESSFESFSEEWMFNEGGSYIAAQSSWDQSKIVFVHNSRCCQVTTSDLQYLLHTIVITNSIQNLNPHWCGNDVLAFRGMGNELTFYSMAGDEKSLSFSQPFWFDSDSDGIRVFYRNEASLISVVPADMENVLGLVSNKPGAFLFDAHERLIKKEYLAFDCLANIYKQLLQGVDQCLNAAAHHFDPAIQKKLVSAANLGRATFPKYDNNKFVHIISILRCLNAVRQFGLPITFSELNELSLSALVNRIVELRGWPIALKICHIMAIPPKEGLIRIMSNWTHNLLDSAAKSGRPVDSQVLANKIFNQFSKLPDTSYADIAEVVASKGKNFHELAKILLERETDISRQVKMHLKFGNVETALQLADKSRLPDLTYMVIAHLKRTENPYEVERLLLRHNPNAAQLYQGSKREDSLERLLTLYEQQDNFLGQAIIHLSTGSSRSRQETLQKAASCFTKMQNNDLENLVKISNHLHTVTSDYDQKKGTTLKTDSLRDTFIWAVGEGNDDSLAERLKRDYKLTEKQIFHWSLEGYIKSNKKSHLNDLACRKQFTGFLPFVEACVKLNQTELAKDFLKRIDNPDDLIRAYLLLGEPMKAADIAYQKDDIRSLQQIISLCREADEQDKVIKYRSTIKLKLASST